MGDETVSEKKRCVIVGGADIGDADIGDYARVKQYLRADDAIVFCDSGLKPVSYTHLTLPTICSV